MKSYFLFFFALLISSVVSTNQKSCSLIEHPTVKNNCVSSTVSQGTGCAWMCNYCSNQLGTNNYYFTDNVCTYESGVGCVGNPLAGTKYTCCSAGEL